MQTTCKTIKLWIFSELMPTRIHSINSLFGATRAPALNVWQKSWFIIRHKATSRARVGEWKSGIASGRGRESRSGCSEMKLSSNFASKKNRNQSESNKCLLSKAEALSFPLITPPFVCLFVCCAVEMVEQRNRIEAPGPISNQIEWERCGYALVGRFSDRQKYIHLLLLQRVRSGFEAKI